MITNINTNKSRFLIITHGVRIIKGITYAIIWQVVVFFILWFIVQHSSLAHP